MVIISVIQAMSYIVGSVVTSHGYKKLTVSISIGQNILAFQLADAPNRFSTCIAYHLHDRLIDCIGLNPLWGSKIPLLLILPGSIHPYTKNLPHLELATVLV